MQAFKPLSYEILDIGALLIRPSHCLLYTSDAADE